MKTFHFEQNSGYTASAYLYEAENAARKNITVVYLHGGGLLYGTADDLPALYLNGFLSAGYDFLSIDYPLAPEYPLSAIIESVVLTLTGLLEKGILRDYILFGRSAGSYLCLAAADRLRRDGQPMPQRLILYYGYYSFAEKEFCRPSPFYLRFPKIDKEELLKNMRKKEEERRASSGSAPDHSADLSHRFNLYVCARQRGDWPDWLGDTGSFSLTDKDLALLPPAFVTASTGDEDVPYRISRNMSKLIPGSMFHPVYFLPHDYDRDTSLPEGREAHKLCLDWLEDITLSSQ